MEILHKRVTLHTPCTIIITPLYSGKNSIHIMLNEPNMCFIHAFVHLVGKRRVNLNMKSTLQSSLVGLIFKLSCVSIETCTRWVCDKGMCVWKKQGSGSKSIEILHKKIALYTPCVVNASTLYNWCNIHIWWNKFHIPHSGCVLIDVLNKFLVVWLRKRQKT